MGRLRHTGSGRGLDRTEGPPVPPTAGGPRAPGHRVLPARPQAWLGPQTGFSPKWDLTVAFDLPSLL